MSHCEVGLSGPLADAILDLIRARFGEVTSLGTTLIVDGLDPAGERALLTLLWDTGHDVVSLHAVR